MNRPIRSLLLAVATACTVLVSAVALDTPVVGAIAPTSQRVMLVTDSVGLGTRGVLDDFFPPDWDVSIVGQPASFVEQLESNFVRPNLFRAGDHVVIAGGYNYPFWDADRFERSVDSIINTLTQAGVKHVYWVTLREVKPQYVSSSAWRQVQPYYWYFPTVNDHLEAALSRHANLTLIDWAAAADRPGITYDAIHLNRDGAELYSSLIRRAVDDAARRPGDFGVTRVNVADPADVASGEVSAVAVNLTSVRGRTKGFVAAYPCEQETSNGSNLNHERDQVVAASAIIPVGASGDICVFNQRAGHIVIDTFGTFGAGARLVSTTTKRVLDSRSPSGSPKQAAGVERRIPVITNGLDGERSRTVALNVTVVKASAKGFLAVHECGVEPPDTSNVNYQEFFAAPNLVIATTDDDGYVCATANQEAHIVVDRLAVFGLDTTIQAATPERLKDTRGGPAPTAEQVIEIDVQGPDGIEVSEGVVGNLTIVRPFGSGFATVYPCTSERPGTSNINYRPGVNIANAVTVTPDANGKVCVYTSGAVEVLFDLIATTGSGFDGISPERLEDTRQR